MVAEGLVSTRWETADAGPARKLYSLTLAGRRRYRALTASWLESVELVTGLLTAAVHDDEGVAT